MAEITTPSGLNYKDTTEGGRDAAKAGRTVSVHYTGWLADGRIRFQPGPWPALQLPTGGRAGDPQLGRRRSGRESERRAKAHDSPALGYGARGAGDVIPPDATLVFEVELLKIG